MASLGPITVPLIAGDPVDQTTARLAELNRTLEALNVAERDPMQQNKDERTERRRLRREVYAELLRLVSPDARPMIVPPSMATPVAPTAEDNEEFERGGPHGGL